MKNSEILISPNSAIAYDSEFLRKAIEKALSDVVVSVLPMDSKVGVDSRLYKKLISFLLRPGKRLRSLCFLCSYLGYSDSIPRGLFRTAAAAELVHAFMLIHDDLIDNSGLRRGKPSLHIAFERELSSRNGHSAAIGKNAALIFGDMIFACAIEAFLSVNCEPDRKLGALNHFLKAAQMTGKGYILEILSPGYSHSEGNVHSILKTYELKTGYYSFSAPLCAGATLAGAPESDILSFHSSGLLLGRAFQLRDDLMDLACKPQTLGKPPMNDLLENRDTFPLKLLFQRSSDSQKKRLLSITQKKNSTLKDHLWLKTLLNETKVMDDTRDQIFKDVNAALKSIRAIHWSSKINPLWESIISTIRSWPEEK